MVPAISIVIPTYNEEKYIGDTINGLTHQVIWPWSELIIADYDPDKKGTTVNSILKAVDENTLKKITHVPIQKAGIGHARHMGCMAAHGDVIVNFDADSSFAWPNGMQQLIAPLYRDAVMTHCLNQIYPNDMQKWGNNINIQVTNEFYKARSIFHSAGLPFPYEPGLAMTRQAYHTVGGFRDVVWLEGPLLGLDTTLSFGTESIKHLDSLLIYVSGRRVAGSKVLLDLNYNNAYR